MELVINISNALYNRILDKVYSKADLQHVCGAIVYGTPLPEHHGDLIDRDALIYTQTHHCGYQTPFNLIDEDNLKSAPTIIEANKGE